MSLPGTIGWPLLVLGLLVPTAAWADEDEKKEEKPSQATDVKWLLEQAEKNEPIVFSILTEGMVRPLDAPELTRWVLVGPYQKFALVYPGSSLARAGIREGDILLQVEGVDVHSCDEIEQVLKKHRIGEEIDLLICRKGSKWSKRMVLGSSKVSPEEGVAYLRGRVAEHDPECCYFLGLLYLQGIGVLQDSTEAYRLLREAAERGVTCAQVKVACRYWNGSIFTKDAEDSFGWLWLAAELGNLEALHGMGYMFLLNQVLPRDEEIAYRYFRIAAKAGCPRCQTAVGAMTLAGNGTNKSPTRAAHWLCQAASKGRCDAALMLAKLYRYGAPGIPVNRKEAVRLYHQAAEGGETEAQNILAFLYLTGADVKQDLEEGARWVRRVAEAGDGDWQCLLALMHLKGEGVPENPIEAVKWLLEAGTHGHASAQAFLGMLYLKGQGLVADQAQALEWFRRSAKQGDQTGQLFLGAAYRYGWAEQKPSAARAARLFQQAAYQGNPSALRELALCYRKGLGVNRDPARGRELLRKSADRNDADAASLYRLLGGPIVRWCPALARQQSQSESKGVESDLSRQARLLNAEEKRAGHEELVGSLPHDF